VRYGILIVLHFLKQCTQQRRSFWRAGKPENVTPYTEQSRFGRVAFVSLPYYELSEDPRVNVYRQPYLFSLFTAIMMGILVFIAAAFG
jgi:hypothetical protein